MKQEDNVWSLRLRAAKIPFIIVSSFYVLALLAGLLSFSLYQSVFMSSFLGPVIIIAAFIIGSYIAFVDYNIPKKRVIQGAFLAGLGIGLVAAIISIILLKNTALMGTNVELFLEKAAQMGAPISESMAETQIMIGAYANFFVSPLINGGLGALFAWIGTMVAKRFEEMHQTKKKKK